MHLYLKSTIAEKDCKSTRSMEGMDAKLQLLRYSLTGMISPASKHKNISKNMRHFIHFISFQHELGNEMNNYTNIPNIK